MGRVIHKGNHSPHSRTKGSGKERAQCKYGNRQNENENQRPDHERDRGFLPFGEKGCPNNSLGRLNRPAKKKIQKTRKNTGFKNSLMVKGKTVTPHKGSQRRGKGTSGDRPTEGKRNNGKNERKKGTKAKKGQVKALQRTPFKRKWGLLLFKDIVI